MSDPPTATGPDVLELYERALPQVYGYLLSRCRQRQLAEDLTSETFLAAVRAVSGEVLSVPWLIGVARHKLADHWRRQERDQRLQLALEDLGAGPEPEDPWEVQLDIVWARQLLDRLAPQHRAALTLRYLDGLPVAEVAGYLQRSEHATEALLVRARRAFRLLYEQGGAL